MNDYLRLANTIKVQAMENLARTFREDNGITAPQGFEHFLAKAIAQQTKQTINSQLTFPCKQEKHSPQKLQGVSTDFDGLIEKASRKYGVSPRLIRSVIEAESGFNPRAQSPAGAQGLMQLMPATARALGASDPFDPAQNIEAGTKYLHQLLKQFGGNVALALAAYNAGPGSVEKYGGIPPFAETQNYVKKIIASLKEG